MLKPKLFIHIFIITFSTVCIYPTYANKQSDITIEKLYQTQPKKLALMHRIQWFSQQFMGKPYHLGPLGEGDKGLYDQSPLYRTDAFDCQTYVETVVALSLAKNLETFKKKINAIRYQNPTPSYLNRNHFMSLNWLPNNTQKGFIKDISTTLVNKQNEPVFKTAIANIKKGAWLQKKTLNDIKIKNSSLKRKRLDALKKLSPQFSTQQAKINYIPFDALFDKNKRPNLYLFKQIPSGSIINIVRPNWQLEKLIGTNLNVSHLGFAIIKNKQLYYREASLIEKKVIDVLLIDYLKNYLDSPTIKGINILKVMQRKKQGAVY